jgi:hypothetical protein
MIIDSAITGGVPDGDRQEWCESDISVVLSPFPLIMPSAAGVAGLLGGCGSRPRTGDRDTLAPRQRRDHEVRLEH